MENFYKLSPREISEQYILFTDHGDIIEGDELLNCSFGDLDFYKDTNKLIEIKNKGYIESIIVRLKKERAMKRKSFNHFLKGCNDSAYNGSYAISTNHARSILKQRELNDYLNDYFKQDKPTNVLLSGLRVIKEYVSEEIEKLEKLDFGEINLLSDEDEALYDKKINNLKKFL